MIRCCQPVNAVIFVVVRARGRCHCKPIAGGVVGVAELRYYACVCPAVVEREKAACVVVGVFAVHAVG